MTRAKEWIYETLRTGEKPEVLGMPTLFRDQDGTLWFQRKDGTRISTHELLEEFAAARCAQVEADLEKAKRGYTKQEIALDCLDRLEAAGCGVINPATGHSPHGNTLHGMVIEIIERAEAAESEVTKLKQEIKDLREDMKSSEIERSRNADRFSREGY